MLFKATLHDPKDKSTDFCITIGIYQEGDFVANFHGCARDAARNCEEEMKPLMTRWRELRDGERRK